MLVDQNPSKYGREEEKGKDGRLTGEKTATEGDGRLRGEDRVGIAVPTCRAAYLPLRVSTTAVGRGRRRERSRGGKEGSPSGGTAPLPPQGAAGRGI